MMNLYIYYCLNIFETQQLTTTTTTTQMNSHTNIQHLPFPAEAGGHPRLPRKYTPTPHKTRNSIAMDPDHKLAENRQLVAVIQSLLYDSLHYRTNRILDIALGSSQGQLVDKSFGCLAAVPIEATNVVAHHS
jgi:hypothetical protein